MGNLPITPDRGDESRPGPEVIDAIDALRVYGDDLSRAQVRTILPMWAGYHRLSSADQVAVLKAFDDGWTPGAAQPGGGMISGPMVDDPLSVPGAWLTGPVEGVSRE